MFHGVWSVVSKDGSNQLMISSVRFHTLAGIIRDRLKQHQKKGQGQPFRFFVNGSFKGLTLAGGLW